MTVVSVTLILVATRLQPAAMRPSSGTRNRSSTFERGVQPQSGKFSMAISRSPCCATA